MAEVQKCTCGHHSPSHHAERGRCAICQCERFTPLPESWVRCQHCESAYPDDLNRCSNCGLDKPAQQFQPLDKARVLRILRMLSRSQRCWCGAGMSSLEPDHNEICLEVRAFVANLEGRRAAEGD